MNPLSTQARDEIGRFGALRRSVGQLTNSRRFEIGVLAVVVINAAILGLLTSERVMGTFGTLLHRIDIFIIGLFCVEMILRIFADGLRFFRDPWKIFDLLVVSITLVPLSDASVSALRALRLIRMFRLLTFSARLRRPVEAVLHAIPQVGSVCVLLAVVFYVFAVIVTTLFAPTFPEWFGTIGRSLFSLFQIMTLESWSTGLVRPVMEAYPWAWTIFVLFIVVSTFMVLNLFIAIVTDSMQVLHEKDRQDRREIHERELGETVAAVRAELMRTIESAKGGATAGNPMDMTSQLTRDALRGSLEAQYALGLAHATGEGMPQDYVRSYAWLNVASASGHPDSGAHRDRALAKMTANQIERGQELASEIWERIGKGGLRAVTPAAEARQAPRE